MKKRILLLILSVLSFSAYAQLPLEGFEGGTFPPTNWAVFDNGVSAATNVNWTTNVNSYQGAVAAYMNRPGNIGQNNVSEDYLATYLVNIPNNGQLRFYARTFTAGNSGTTMYQVKVAPGTAPINQTTPLAYSTLLAEYNEDQVTLATDGITQNTFDTYTEKIINFPNSMWGTQVYIAFVLKYTQPGTTLNGDRWLLDNVEVREQCLVPTGLAATPLATSASLAWTGLGASFEIENIQGTGAPTGVATHTTATNSLNITGLTPNTQYCYYVRAICAPGNNSPWAGPFCYTTTTLPPGCGGNYVDAGGTAASYPANSDETVTICPINVGDVVTVTFTSFNTEANWDGMYVYNGNSTAANQISSGNPAGNVPGGVPGAFWGTTIPGPFTSSSPDGCLTFRFRSDGAVNNPGWIANVTCGPAPTCPNPLSLTASAVTSNSASLTWVSNSTATTYNILALPCASPAPTATTTGYVSVTTNSNALLSGLNPDTCYDFYVRDECSSTDFSNWISLTNITTQSPPPVCGGTFLDSGGSTANYSNSEDITVTICPVNVGDVVTVSFTEFDTETNWDGLYVFNGNSILSPQIPSGNPAGNVPGGVPGSYWGTIIPGPFTSSSPDGCLTFRFRSDGSVNRPGWNANVSCGLPPTCPNPNGLSATNITSNSANLTWTSNSSATTYNIIALPCGSPAPTSTTSGYQNVGTNTNASLTGLNPDTCYDIYVRDECGPSDFSIWIGVTNITTQIAPPVCGELFTDPGGVSNNYANSTDYIVTICPTIPGQQVTVTFTSFDTETNWDGLYIYDSDTVGNNQIASTNPAGNVPGGIPGSFWGTTIPDPITASNPTGCLSFRFRSDGSVNRPGWVANVTCAPPPTCPRPSNIVVSNITQTSAQIAWAEIGSATQWQVLVLPSTAPNPDANTPGWINANINPFTYTPLNSGTQYKVYVRAFCNANDISLWSNAVIFATLITNDNCETATLASVNPDTNCVQVTGGTLIGATQSPNANGCGGTADDDVWFQFTATSTSHSLDLLNITGSTTDLVHALYSGNCTNLTQIYCSDPNQSSASGLIVGQTYYIRVFSFTATPNQTTVFNLCIGTIPPPIIANDNVYTNVQLVEDILFNSTCATVTNVTTSSGSNFGQGNGIGYFNKNGSSFPFNDGVVLSTKFIENVPGPNIAGSNGTAAWTGDADLFNYVTNSGIDPFLTSYNNASILEFDFIPLIENISFDFIFASDEYGTFQCDYSDAFAFLLTNNTTGVTTNLAIVPNTTLPISVLTIRDNAYNNGCASVNPQYFADYYGLPQGSNPLGAPINFNGVTVPLTATSAVLPGQQYHIKLVIADRNDSAFDSAVFLEGGSFNFGLELGIDFLIAGGNALCAGSVNQLTSNLNPNQYSFVWTNNGVVIPNENGPNLLINQTGNYALTATLNNTSCSATDSIIVEYYDPIVLSTPNNLTVCDASGFAQFNLSQNNASVLGSYPAAQHTVSYYLTQADATNETNALPNLYTNTTQFIQTIYARVENVAGCFGTTQFNLVVQNLTPQFTITPETTICNGSSATLTVTPQNYNNNDVTFSWTLNGNPLSFNSPSITVGQAGIYAVTVNNQGCTASASTTLNTQVCEINIYASAVWMDDCTTVGDGKFYNTSGTGADLINQDGSLFASNYGVHVQNSGTLVMRGAEIKTQKSTSSNVCSANMNYRIFQTGNTPSTFAPWNLPFYSDCNTGLNTFDVGGGPCTTGQQKWQCVSQPGCTAPLDLTTLPPGNYTIQVYYDITGSYTTNNGCADTYTLDNGGSYFVTNFTIQAPATLTSTNPTTCNGTDGTITINNLSPNATYSLTYSDDTVVVGPTNVTANTSGQVTLTGLNAGTYNNFSMEINSCSTSVNGSITLVDPAIPSVTVNSESICIGSSTTITATPNIVGNYSYVWSVPSNTTNPGNVNSFTASEVGTYSVVITNTVTNCVSLSASGTISNLPDSTLVLTSGSDNQTVCINTAIASITYTSSDATSVTVTGLPLGVSGTYNNGTFVISGTPTESGTFNYTVTTVATCASQSLTGVINVDPDVTMVLTTGNNNQSVCINSPITSIDYSTTNGVTNATVSGLPNGVTGTFTSGILTISGIPTESGTFNYSVSTVGGCSSVTLTGTLTVNPVATITLTSGNNTQPLCINTPVSNIVYTTTGATNVTVSGLPLGVSGTFNNGTFTISGSPTESGTFNYTVSTVGGCTVENLSGSIIVSPNVTLTLNSGNNSQSVCINTAIASISYTTTNGVTNIVATGLPNGVLGTFNAGVYTLSGSPTAAGTFNYTLTTTGGCSTATASGSIVVNPLVTPTFSFGTSLTICPGITPPALPTGSSNGNIQGTWSPSSINNTTNGVYTFTPNATECATTTTLSVTVQSAFDFVINGDCVGNQFIVQADPINNGYNEDTASYEWSYNGVIVGTDETFNLTAYLNSTVINEPLPINITLQVTDSSGCFETNNEFFGSIYCNIQKGISPNGDGKNEFFDLRNQDVSELKIYNRHGIKVYNKVNYSNEWIGQTNSGEELPDGTYYYVIEFKNSQEPKTGWIYINRQN